MVNRKNKHVDSRHPELGRIKFTRHLVIRTVERVYDANRQESTYELRCEALKWLRLGIKQGKALKWYCKNGNSMVLTSAKESAIQVGGFVVLLVLDRQGIHTAKTLISVEQCG